jgi:hypothetical protein
LPKINQRSKEIKMRNLLLLLCALAAAANAGSNEVSLKDKIAEALEANLQVSAKGVENCENKCDKVFNRFAYLISTDGNTPTYEYQACLIGCSTCSADLEATADKTHCFTTCKNNDWAGQGIVKGVIEPDKACMAGCVIQTCQVICAGGTTQPYSAALKPFFYPNGGCSIKTASYSQNEDYVPWDSPNTGEGGNNDVAKCCANALSLCQYVGNTSSENYKQLLANTGNMCAKWVPTKKQPQICDFYNIPQNCGSL